MLAELQREGPHAGRTLTLQYRPLLPLSINTAGEEVADVGIVGKWSDGKPVEDVEPLRAVTLAETVVTHMSRLNSEFEKRYPGARIKSTFSSPDPDRLTQKPHGISGASVHNDQTNT